MRHIMFTVDNREEVHARLHPYGAQLDGEMVLCKDSYRLW
jgi:hypothetical protein